MLLTLSSGIFATSSRARAEEPPDGVDAGAPGEPSRTRVAEPNREVASPANVDAGVTPAIVEVGVGAAVLSTPPPVAPQVVAEKPDEPPREGKGKKRKAKDKDDAAPAVKDHPTFGNLEVKGRVYARAELDRRESVILDEMLVPRSTHVNSLDLSVPTARVSLHYRAPVEWLSAIAELDISGNPDMKDGYVQARDAHFTARAGQFKVPVSPLAATSPWTLPFVRRGFLHDVLVDRLDYGGRRPGIMLGWRDRNGLHPRILVAAFQGSVVTRDPTAYERRTDLLSGNMLRSQSLVARAEIEVAGADIGVYYEDRIGSPAPLRTARYWTAGADLVFDRVFANGGLRVWIDGISGASWYEHASKPADDKDAIFLSGRTLIAYRFGGTVDDAFYVEPYGLAGVFDPDLQMSSDFVFEGVLGVNVGLWKRARLSLQGEVNQGMRNFPDAYYLGRPPQRLGLILQAGVAF